MFGEREAARLGPHCGGLGRRQVLQEGLGGLLVLAVLEDDGGVTAADDRRLTAADGREREEVGVLADLLAELVLGDTGDEVALVDHAGLGLRPEDLLDRAREVGVQGALLAARDELLVLEELAEGGEGVDDGGVGPLQLVGGEGVVLLGSGLGEVDVLEPVGEGPAVLPGHGERGETGIRHGPAGLEHVVVALRGLHAGLLEGVGAVPDGRLVGGLEVQAVEGAVDAAVLLPHGGVSRVDGLLGLLRQRLEPALPRELLEHADLRDHHDVGGVATLDLAADDGGDVVAGGRELRLGAGLLGEGVEHLLEVLLLGAGPDAGHGDRLAAERLVAAAGRDGPRRRRRSRRAPGRGRCSR
ncbi:hypothetical protein QFZ55_002027 [Streptomyces luteogriseus]|nr:hypothetical protein [Streptomyces luteogriseus]